MEDVSCFFAHFLALDLDVPVGIAWAPDVVICNLGINDITEWGAFTQEQFETEHFQLTDAFIQSGNDPLIIQWHKLAPLYPGQSFYGDPDIAP